MSDITEEDEPGIVTEEPDTYVVTISRTIELDIGMVMGERLQQNYEADTVEAALAKSVAEVEANQVEATQKLLNLDVSVDGPSDD